MAAVWHIQPGIQIILSYQNTKTGPVKKLPNHCCRNLLPEALKDLLNENLICRKLSGNTVLYTLEWNKLERVLPYFELF
jgi:hypothetical protein